ncbi:uncharacterized protein LOC116346688 [Contarinia nasturtii]|uniref:uncharacterized protein LOC116346688 n=1 Tax=Contarinia nasturtii TaxID=265458 RepID=UPI0012D46641|nr:uncharacterized protein LOC116346688 [Contarinia nasturtii]
MGVYGLQNFLKREQRVHIVNIIEEINKWKSENPEQTPIIVIDFMSLSQWELAKKPKDNICGGRINVTEHRWSKMLKAIHDTGCHMVFISDVKSEVRKSATKIGRRNEQFDSTVKLYEEISNGCKLDKVVSQIKTPRGLSSELTKLASIAKELGEFHYAINFDCDLECAKYATQYNAIAVVSQDTDFLIFEGSWKLWSPDGIPISQTTKFKMNEYDRNAIKEILSLEEHHWPIFASLAGNDFTKEPFSIRKQQIEQAARWTRKLNSVHPSDAEFRRVVAQFRHDDAAKAIDLIKESIRSYDLNFSPVIDDDPLIKGLSKTSMFRTYMSSLDPVKMIGLNYYDLRGCEQAEYLPILLIDWTKRRFGIVHKHKQSDENQIVLTFLAQKKFNEKFEEYKEEPEYPDFSVPPLIELYLHEGNNEIIATKWKLLAFIMKLSDDEVTAIKRLAKEFILISTTVFILVKSRLITKKQADGILYTAHMVLADKTNDVTYPTVLVAQHVRAAHIYNSCFAHVKRNIYIAGLCSHIEGSLAFDGVYFQKLMEQFDDMEMKKENDEYVTFIAPILKYRIYEEI